MWSAWTDPSRFEKWWIPAPTLCRVDRLDVRPGGALVTRLSDDGVEFVPHLDACFLVVDELERIVFTNAIDSAWRPANPSPVPMTAEITLSDHPDGTDYRIIVRHGDPAARARHEKTRLRRTAGARSPNNSPGSPRARARCEDRPYRVRHSRRRQPGSRLADRGHERRLHPGGWLVPYLDEVFVRRTSDWLGLADGLLLGRRTYEAFARDWPQITDPDDPFTERMNSLPKYVVTNTLTEGSLAPDDRAPRRPDPHRRGAQGAARTGAPDPRQRATRQGTVVGRPRRHTPTRRRPHRGRFRAAAARPPERDRRPPTASTTRRRRRACSCSSTSMSAPPRWRNTRA